MIVAELRLRWRKKISEVDADASAHAPSEAISLRRMMNGLARNRELLVSLDQEGRWHSRDTFAEQWMNGWFGEHYRTTEYNPRGKLNTVARHAASVLGAELSWLKADPPPSPDGTIH